MHSVVPGTKDSIRRNTHSGIGRTAYGLEISPGDGVSHELGGPFQVQFGHDIGTVVLHGTGADAEKLGNLFARFPLRGEHQNFSFPDCQPLALRSRAAIPSTCLCPGIRHFIGKLGTHVGAALPYLLYRGEELRVRIFFQDVSVSAGRYSRNEEFHLFVHGQDEYLQLGLNHLDLMDCLDAPQVGHRDIEHDKVRGQSLQEPEELQAIIRLPDHFQATHSFEDPPQTLPEQDVIIGEDNAVRRHHRLPPFGTDTPLGTEIPRVIRVPFPCSLHTLSDPPNIRARSSIVASPKPLPEASFVTASFTSKPLPSSSTTKDMWSSCLSAVRHTRLASACFATFVRAS